MHTIKDYSFRRLFSKLIAPAAVFATLFCFSMNAAIAAENANPNKTAAGNRDKTCLLQSSRKAGSIDRVTVKLDAGGNLKFVEDKKVGREKMSVVAELQYSEKTLELPKSASQGNSASLEKDEKDSDGAWRAVRYYDQAEAVIKVGAAGFKPTLPDDRRVIAVNAGENVSIFSPQGPLSREELDLLDISGNSLLLDRLLPSRAVGEGDSWQHPQPLMAELLGLDKIETYKVQSKLEKLTSREALIAMNGHVEGAIGGVTTRMEVKAKYRFLRKTGRIDWFGLLVKEDRDIGHVDAGFELVARIQMQIKPIDACEQLDQSASQELSLKPAEKMTRLIYRSKTGGWEFSHDRRWFVTADRKSRAVLRMVDSGELIAQCNVTALEPVEPGKQITLEQFQNDVKEALGDSFGELITASQHANEADYRVLRVVAEGESSQLPIRWIYYLIADVQGRQVALTFTVEKSLVERLATADRSLAETLRFADQTNSVAQKDAEEAKR